MLIGRGPRSDRFPVKRRVLGTRVGLTLVLMVAVSGCGSSATRTPADSPSIQPTGSGASLPDAAGAAPVCPPIPPVAPPATSLDQPGWWRDRVFAEVFVRSYADSDGDGIGDLAGLTGKL